MGKEEVRGPASRPFVHGAVALAFQTFAVLKNLADHAQCGWSYREIDTKAEPGLTGLGPRWARTPEHPGVQGLSMTLKKGFHTYFGAGNIPARLFPLGI